MKKIILSSTASDSHTWNLVYLQLLLEEYHYQVLNLGNCIPEDVLIKQCYRFKPHYVVISSVNGHGFQEGLGIARAIKQHQLLQNIDLIIGGKLNTRNSDTALIEKALVEAGYSHVFQGDDAIKDFKILLDSMTIPQRQYANR